MDMSLSKLWELVKDKEACMLQSMGLQRVRHELGNEQYSYHSWKHLLQHKRYINIKKGFYFKVKGYYRFYPEGDGKPSGAFEIREYLF